MSDDKKELEQYADDLGKKLGFLIASLNTSAENKEAFLEIISDFDLSQLERITEILETKYLSENTDFVEKEFRKDLEVIRDTMAEELVDLNNKTIKRLSI